MIEIIHIWGERNPALVTENPYPLPPVGPKTYMAYGSYPNENNRKTTNLMTTIENHRGYTWARHTEKTAAR